MTFALVAMSHSRPPLMMLVVIPYPGTRPNALSCAVGCQRPVIASWHDGFGDCGVIQNQSPAWYARVAFVATWDGSLMSTEASPKMYSLKAPEVVIPAELHGPAALVRLSRLASA